MKINRINYLNMNPYKNQPATCRHEKLQHIKNKIDAGQYQADLMEVARKFYEYWIIRRKL
ncbi:flagellar biosynthesis anti-sigma factor FlgM [Fictibacillus fluitans]|uniref:Flagellar biosynthesis anti-sigma factor FlgM n=1 Tax=Fictibacillus fluitans TaxID=3058422 RepID=A0ABT8HZA6_9BACL|nr:flagellar biosynthesis anti-sigma factor FlgM [Fictibacillus sp. NE201]MDN4526121.1 flagellar biosynthesis anti-sigma factor FlgM [Fictibacillus sp. NE201]